MASDLEVLGVLGFGVRTVLCFSSVRGEGLDWQEIEEIWKI